jgi:hypothetical protein
VLENYYQNRDKNAVLKFIKKLCIDMDNSMRSSQIGFDPTKEQQKRLAVHPSKLDRDGQIT